MNDQSTKTFSNEIGIKQESIHARLSRFGSYFGVRPIKLPNGRLRWPTNAVEILRRQARTF